jgi:hypothetical protein
MIIEIPQYLRAEVAQPAWDDPYDTPTRVDVYIGDTIVFTKEVDRYYSDELAAMEAMTAFGAMLKLKIGDKT